MAEPHPQRRLVTVVVFLVAFLVLALWYLHLPVLYDTDAYYHLAVARYYAAEGPAASLPWARMSLLHEGFGDKELLFHLLLAPFAAFGHAEVGGRIALALLGAAVLALLVVAAEGAAGRWAAAVPIVVVLGSQDFFGRLIRLRPELLALLLVLAATLAAARRRWVVLGVVAAVYALAYTAWHALVGLAVLWLLHQGLVRRRWEPRLVLAPALGVAVGLLVHPHFPHNLVVWKVQSLDFFVLKPVLDVGREIRPPTLVELLRSNLGWLLALLVLARAAHPPVDTAADATPDARTRETADLLVVAAAAYGVLYLAMIRFSTYAVPLATLALLWELRSRGRRVGAWAPLTGRRGMPTSLGLALAFLVAAPASWAVLGGLSARGGPGGLEREEEWAAFGRAMPDGARVAADWGATHLYMFWAPQGRYLNVLDPVFMAVPHPAEHRLLRDVLDGHEPDPALAVVAGLASDHLALSAYTSAPRLRRRLAGDPRFRPLHAAHTLLYVVRPAGDAFLRDWRAAGGEHPLPSAGELAGWRAYPRAADPDAAVVEGYVDAARLALDGHCATFARPVHAAGPTTRRLQLAPWGDAALFLDGRRLATVAGDGAVLGTGTIVDVDVTPGPHLLAVVTCPGPDGLKGGRNGFYLVDRT